MQPGTVPELVVVVARHERHHRRRRRRPSCSPPSARCPTSSCSRVHVDRSWVPGNNDLIQSLPGQFPNVTSLNWDALAAGCVEWARRQGLTGNCFASDGFHLSADGADYYVELIRYTPWSSSASRSDVARGRGRPVRPAAVRPSVRAGHAGRLWPRCRLAPRTLLGMTITLCALPSPGLPARSATACSSVSLPARCSGPTPPSPSSSSRSRRRSAP